MMTDAIGWICSLVLLALLAFGLRGNGRAHRYAPAWVWLLLQLTATASLVVQSFALGHSVFAATLAVATVNTLYVLRRLWNDRRGTVITLYPANDEGSAVRLRVLSHVLQRDERRALHWH